MTQESNPTFLLSINCCYLADYVCCAWKSRGQSHVSMSWRKDYKDTDATDPRGSGWLSVLDVLPTAHPTACRVCNRSQQRHRHHCLGLAGVVRLFRVVGKLCLCFVVPGDHLMIGKEGKEYIYILYALLSPSLY